jgi:hypothetical protein
VTFFSFYCIFLVLSPLVVSFRNVVCLSRPRPWGTFSPSPVVLVLCVNHVEFLFIPSCFLIFLFDGTSIPSTPGAVVIVVARFVTGSIGDTFRGLGDLLVACYNITHTHKFQV